MIKILMWLLILMLMLTTIIFITIQTYTKQIRNLNSWDMIT